ncbi:protein-disulfide reductase DsbD [Ventosimonas gracilis]|uniref:Thiol:disulfide interchange protein DsbD n=2 Tax=Ventosimonas gracilis TaxID=1680762 RepID=A0A139SI70_9GAMM|nr:protein-disulfide reductase DsbD [Ventosimonas gracilis]
MAPMRQLLWFLLLLLALPAHADLFERKVSPQLGGTWDNSQDFLPVDEAFRLSLVRHTPEQVTLRLVAAEGYYLYRHRLQVQIEPQELAAGKLILADGEAKTDEYFGDVEVYYGVLDFTLPLNNPAERPYRLQVGYQGCADKGLCYPPQTQSLSIGQLEAANAPPVTEQSGWNWSSLALFFLAGLGLALTPCVLPMLPIVASIVLRGEARGVRALSLSLAYVVPMALCFALLGVLTGLFGASLNLQARLQSPWVLVPFAAFFVLFALAMFGLFELRLPQAILAPLQRLAGRRQGGSLLGAAWLGLFSALLVSPCVSAPLAGALLYISASGDGLGGGLKLFALGLGMGVPLLLLAAGGGALLPKSGNWLLLVRQLFGVLLLAVALWLLERVLPGSLALLLWALLAAGCAFFLLRRWHAQAKWFARPAALLLISYSALALMGAGRGGADPLKPWAGAAETGQWQTFTHAQDLEQALAEARRAGQPVLLDWYADWCISCKIIEREVFADRAIQLQLADWRLLRFDITESNPQQRATLDHYRLFGPPAILFFDADGQERRDMRIVGEISADEFVRKLEQAQ